MHAYIHTYIHTYMHTYIHTYIHICVLSLSISIYLYIIYISLSIYIYIYIHIVSLSLYIYIYIYTHITGHSSFSARLFRRADLQDGGACGRACDHLRAGQLRFNIRSRSTSVRHLEPMMINCANYAMIYIMRHVYSRHISTPPGLRLRLQSRTSSKTREWTRRERLRQHTSMSSMHIVLWFTKVHDWTNQRLHDAERADTCWSSCGPGCYLPRPP